MSNENQKTKKYDLKQRTAEFGKDIILFARKLSIDQVNKPLINQLIRASTSIGANYMEADGAESRNDFFHKIGICRKEAKEASYWLYMISVANKDKSDDCKVFIDEVNQLSLIFSSIIQKK